MPVKVDQTRRLWTVRAVKAFAVCEALSLRDLRKTIGQKALNELFAESFITHPDDPIAGAELARTNLYKRYGERLSRTTSSA